MAEAVLHLLKIPLRADKLAGVARRRGIPLRDLDDGYLVHCVLRELWQEIAPAPFVLRGRGRHVDAWGYSRAPASALVDRLRAFSDPALAAVIDDPGSIVGRQMPELEAGRRVGFHLRSSPVVRLAKGLGGHRAGAEVDAFLAACWKAGPETTVHRERVYRDWLERRLQDPKRTGVNVERISVTGFARERLVRRTQGDERKVRRLERPDVHFDGELSIAEGRRFLDLLARGVGRHRAFGFGALMIVAPRTRS